MLANPLTKALIPKVFHEHTAHMEINVMSLLHANNTSAIQMKANPVYHKQTKYIEVNCHSIQEVYDRRVVTLPHALTSIQTTDIFIKSLT
ncbi:hypothetical protein CR513_56817, partial [Mucuna pruriens]